MTFEVGCHRQRILNAAILLLFFFLGKLKESQLNDSVVLWDLFLVYIFIGNKRYLHQRVYPPHDSFVAVDLISVHIDKILHYLCTISLNKAFPLHQTLCCRYCFRHRYEGAQFHCCHLISMSVLIYSHNPYCYCSGCDNFDCCCGFCWNLARIGIQVAPFHHEIYRVVLQLSLIAN